MTVFEAMPEAGGILVFGIPDHRVDKRSVRLGVRELMDNGVFFVFNTRVGRDVRLESLVEVFDSVVIATGAWRSRRLNAPGEESGWVLRALEWLSLVHLARLGYEPFGRLVKPEGRVLVVGAGYTAVDVVTVLLDYPELRSRVESITLSYRRSRREAPSGAASLEELERRGVRILEYTTPVGFREEERGRVVELAKTRITESGSVEVTSEKIEIEVDYVLLAIGLEPAPLPTELELKRRSDGTLVVDEKMMTSIPGVFACGDAVHGPSRIGVAIKSGLRVARSVDSYLRSSKRL